MTPDRAAITALQQALDNQPGLDHEQTAVLAVTTLQGLGWTPPTTDMVTAWLNVMGAQIRERMPLRADRLRAHPTPTRHGGTVTEPLPPRSTNPRRQVHIEPDARITRTTALTIAARTHQGRGTSPYRLIQDAEIIAEYLRTGDVIEDPQLAHWREMFENSKGGAIIVLPSDPRRRWWQRRPSHYKPPVLRKPAAPPSSPSGITPGPDDRR